jgi:hypothetical protein
VAGTAGKQPIQHGLPAHQWFGSKHGRSRARCHRPRGGRRQ